MTKVSDNSDEAISCEEPIHEHFGLSYANYLVLPRTLLQSMPIDWQKRFVACLQELDEAFSHIERAEAYEVKAGEWIYANELSHHQRARLGIYGGEEEDDECYYDADGNELWSSDRVFWPTEDPVPHYWRGRTRIEPRLVENINKDGFVRMLEAAKPILNEVYRREGRLEPRTDP